MVSARLSWRDVALGVGRMPAGGAALSIRQMAQVISQWENNWRYRRDLGRLRELGPHMLADIGLSLDEAIIETAKPFWKP
jgi:uncharacterized protein YjiS (DUF1127 family)